MLARQYGYAVTARPAAEAAPWAAADLPASRWLPVPPMVAFLPIPPLLVLVVAGWAWSLGGAGGSLFLAIVAYIGPILLLITSFLIWTSTLANKRLTREMQELLQREPWQAWPCRMEREGEGGTTRIEVIVSLLAPDHSVAGQCKARVRPETWRAMTDGYGVLLFAGDLRFPGVIADPRTETAHLTVPVKNQDLQQNQRNSAVEDELTRQAIAWFFSQ
ncbi:hypothetical protein [Actinomadura chokoriensis]|uniref:Uncharacterized protein n=1 Tax=Actinomadura chokoriensis TaxID=454156 RepID=A0ABV4QWU7_9ACTN